MKVKEILMVLIGILSLIILYEIYNGSLIEGIKTYCNPTIKNPPQLCPGGLECIDCGKDSCPCPEPGPSPTPAPTPPTPPGPTPPTGKCKKPLSNDCYDYCIEQGFKNKDPLCNEQKEHVKNNCTADPTGGECSDYCLDYGLDAGDPLCKLKEICLSNVYEYYNEAEGGYPYSLKFLYEEKCNKYKHILEKAQKCRNTIFVAVGSGDEQILQDCGNDDICLIPQMNEGGEGIGAPCIIVNSIKCEKDFNGAGCQNVIEKCKEDPLIFPGDQGISRNCSDLCNGKNKDNRDVENICSKIKTKCSNNLSGYDDMYTCIDFCVKNPNAKICETVIENNCKDAVHGVEKYRCIDYCRKYPKKKECRDIINDLNIKCTNFKGDKETSYDCMNYCFPYDKRSWVQSKVCNSFKKKYCNIEGNTGNDECKSL
jgi:hypothetical protein